MIKATDVLCAIGRGSLVVLKVAGAIALGLIHIALMIFLAAIGLAAHTDF